MNNTISVSIDCVPAALREFFAEHSTIALAFSGGTDSSYLLYAAKACGANVHAYYVSTPFQPQFELDDAKLLAESLHADMTVLPSDVLTDKVVKSNPKDRCYYCKNQVFGGILKAAKEDGFTEIMDGTNASDDAGDRPGMRALKEMKVLSPLRLSGITKTALREYSRNAGLFTWNKPAYACLATRVPSGISIEASVLRDVEWAEKSLSDLGFRDFRVRVYPDPAAADPKADAPWCAKLQLTEDMIPYGAAEGDLRALKAEIYGCDTGSCGENTVDVGNVSHICTSDLMLCIRRSAKVYKIGNEYNRLNFTGHTRS